MAMRMMLEREYRTVWASDGTHAVDLARAELPDLILLDVVMPGLNGFDTCRALRACPVSARTPIIMVTTRSEMESVVTGYESGCNDYIAKPIDRAELLTKVRAYLASSGESE
jgi:putative two-component system response regulator